MSSHHFFSPDPSVSSPPLRSRAAFSGRRDQRTTLIRIFRILLPVLMVFALLIGLVKPFVTSHIGDISLTGLDITEGRITMENPELIGEDKLHRAFKVRAQRAVQDTKNMQHVLLEDISASFEFSGGGLLELSAKNGSYDKDAETLRLKDNIVISSTLGHVSHLSSALVAFQDGRIVSDEPVYISTPSRAELSAQGLVLTQNGQHMVFKGPVRLVIPQAPH